MARSNVQYQEYLSEIKHEAGILEQKKDFPAALLQQWVHKDICLSCLKLDGIINQLFRTTASLAIASNAGAYDADVTHVEAATTVSGFSGLTPDAWINGSVIVVKTNVLYIAQITDNDATTITISNGTDLPALSGDPAMLSANNGGTYVSLSSLDMINFAEPVWQVVGPDGLLVPPADPEYGKSLKDDYYSNAVTSWRVQGQTVQFDLGSSASMSGTVTVGYYILPTRATADEDYIDFPIEYQEIPKQLTIVRILRKKGMIAEAQNKEVEIENKINSIIDKAIITPKLDRQSNEKGD